MAQRVESASPAEHAELVERFAEVRDRTEELARPLSAEDQTVQSMPDVSPTKWHRAHTSWFFETFILAERDGYARFHDAYEYLFNSYYEGVGPRHPRAERGLVSRPGAAEIGRYRRHVDDAMIELLAEGSAPAGLVELGLHHEQQHQELLLMDIKHVLSCSSLLPAYDEQKLPPGDEVVGEGFAHPGGIEEIGHAGDGFAFDNETPRHRVLLEPFALAPRPVTNGEWLAFIDDDGYRRPELWLSDGWHTVQAEGWEAPLYWLRSDRGWDQFTLAGPVPLDHDAPVCHVSYYEADAFARWAGHRLPTEAEWETAVARTGSSGSEGGLHPRMAATGSAIEALGQVWEWTASPYVAYPGFQPAPGAVGEYNGKFMVNQQVLRGGCCVTPAGHRRTTYRNFYPPSARWAFSGLRLAQDS
jgi:ergothioneine biosynthesis protein EgtB